MNIFTKRRRIAPPRERKGMRLNPFEIFRGKSKVFVSLCTNRFHLWLEVFRIRYTRLSETNRDTPLLEAWKRARRHRRSSNWKKKKKITRRIKVSKNLKGYERRRINDDAQHYGGLQHGGGREREEVEFRGKRVPFAKPVFSSSYIVLLTRV